MNVLADVYYYEKEALYIMYIINISLCYMYFSSNRHLFVALFIISQAHRETFHEKARQARTGSTDK